MPAEAPGPVLETAGEQAVIVWLGSEASPSVANSVRTLATTLQREFGDLIVDLIPSYASLLVIFDPLRCDHMRIRHAVAALHRRQLENDAPTGDESRRCELPVYYDASVGEDLEDVARGAGIAVDELIDLHSGREYRVYAIGFAPGFAYLGEVDERIATPRKSDTRQRVPRGAVAIADRQTAVYPAVSPGGWNLIGRCPTPMFDPAGDPVMPVSVGDTVIFRAIDREEFFSLGGSL